MGKYGIRAIVGLMAGGTSLTLVASILYLLTLPPETEIIGRPAVWWLAVLGALSTLALAALLLWISYLLLTTKPPPPIEEELEKERVKEK